MIPNGITKDLAEIMQVWIQIKSACPPAVKQSPDGSINLPDVDLYIWMKNISPKEDAAAFKQEF